MTFTKFLTIYYSLIHHLHHSPSNLISKHLIVPLSNNYLITLCLLCLFLALESLTLNFSCIKLFPVRVDVRCPHYKKKKKRNYLN
jgi:hypothetical protein